MKTTMKLHIGGKESKEGWKILNALSGKNVDYVGDIGKLSQFDAESCSIVYCSHVLEHVGQRDMVATLQGIRRLLMPGGELMISVPDLGILCKLFLHPKMTPKARVHVMRMMFGGQIDAFDFHYIGFDYEILESYLSAAGFTRLVRVKEFGLFNDTSNYAPFGVPISLNVVAYNVV